MGTPMEQVTRPIIDDKIHCVQLKIQRLNKSMCNTWAPQWNNTFLSQFKQPASTASLKQFSMARIVVALIFGILLVSSFVTTAVRIMDAGDDLLSLHGTVHPQEGLFFTMQ
ncbi:hypothetical protein MKW98_015205 [Papaver atlanticum]|uniref:Uncharacterized protein n=1 Tax=Papaver atlanticum TaxID=357466 RepID=A0AAD4XSN3_9MAGN|nr:hypothetical protein MKW98_015205 [Papaver atlanticum]